MLSIIVLVASTQFHSSQNCPIGGTTEFSVNACISNKYALGLGAFACLVTLVVIILAQVGFIHIYVELACAFLLFIMYAAGVGIITYNQGSGISIGNLVSIIMLQECCCWLWMDTYLTLCRLAVLCDMGRVSYNSPSSCGLSP